MEIRPFREIISAIGAIVVFLLAFKGMQLLFSVSTVKNPGWIEPIMSYAVAGMLAYLFYLWVAPKDGLWAEASLYMFGLKEARDERKELEAKMTDEEKLELGKTINESFNKINSIENEVMKMLDVYNPYIKKHRVSYFKVNRLRLQIWKYRPTEDIPKLFKVDLLNLLVHHGATELAKELDELKGATQPEPTETAEEREWREEAEASARAGFARKFESEEAIVREHETQKKKVWTDFDDKKITREALEYKLNRLEEIKNELLQDLKIRDTMNE